MAQQSRSKRVPYTLLVEEELTTRERARKRAPPPWAGERDGLKPEQTTARFKLVLIGDASVGKSSLVLRYLKDRFDEIEKPTIGASFLSHTFDVGKTTVKYEIWDTAGQQQYRSLMPVFFRGAQALFFVYDISNGMSYEGAKNWLCEVEQEACPNRVAVLLGNKADLASKRAVDYEVAKTYAEEKDLLFMETSAKTGKNVDEIFLAVAKRLVEISPKKQQEDLTDKSGETAATTFEPPNSPEDKSGEAVTILFEPPNSP